MASCCENFERNLERNKPYLYRTLFQYYHALPDIRSGLYLIYGLAHLLQRRLGILYVFDAPSSDEARHFSIKVVFVLVREGVEKKSLERDFSTNDQREIRELRVVPVQC